MTGTELAALIRFKTGGTTATTFPNSEMTPLVNIFKNEIASKIVEKNSGYFLIPEVFDLVASSTTREYAFPLTMLNRMKKVELKFNSTDARQPSTYLKDYSGSETESEIVNNFGNGKGEFAHTIRRRALFILSGTITAVTGGGRLLCYQQPEDIDLTGSTELSTDPTTTTFGFPIPFQELLARRVSIEWKGAQLPKPIPLSRHELNYENDLKLALDAISTPDESAEVVGDELPPQDTGNNGFDY